MSTPIVSVIIPVYNVMPWLTECVQSVLDQTIGASAVEIVAVDDGSTDGSGPELDRLAAQAANLRVTHLPGNSGGPGLPCNIGVAQATGRYLFFLGGDDYLGTEALARMVAMAERAGSDIVLGRTAPVPGYGTRSHQRIWTRNRPRADLFTTRVYDSLGQIKLFRRDFFTGLNRPFEVGRRLASDQPVVAYAYLHADVISIVADYDCYYIRDRRDGTNATARPDDPVEFIAHVDGICRMLADHIPPGRDRDHLVERHVRNEVLKWAVGRCWDDPDTDRPALLTAAGDFLRDWLTPGVVDELTPLYRVMADRVLAADEARLTRVIRFQQSDAPRRAIVEGDRVYVDLPLFGDPEAGVPDRYYDVTERLTVRHRVDGCEWRGSRVTLTGAAWTPQLPGEPHRTYLVLRERDTGAEHRIPARPGEAIGHGDEPDGAAFRVECDLSTAADGGPLPDGRWDLLVAVEFAGGTRDHRIGAVHGDGYDLATSRRVVDLPGRDPALVTAHTTRFGNLTLRLESRPGASRRTALLTESIRAGSRLRLKVRAGLADWPTPLTAALCLRRGTDVRRVPARSQATVDGLDVTGTLAWPGTGWLRAAWTVVLRLDWPGGGMDLPVASPRGRTAGFPARPPLRRILRRIAGAARRAVATTATPVAVTRAETRPGGRGTVVMLVDNAVVSDSRVQKTARSAAENGWDVTLLGRSPDKRPRTWRIGGARVRLIPMRSPLRLRPAQFRKDWLHRPLAYPAGRTSAWRVQKAKARRADLDTRLAAWRVRTAPDGPGPLDRLTLLGWRFASASAKLSRRWVALRERQTTAAKRDAGRGDLRGRAAYARLWGRFGGARAWRHLDPSLWDYELAFGPVVDALRPDIVHANDFRMLGVGARAVLRARAAGRPTRLVWDAHEYLPGIKPWRDDPRWLPAMTAHETEHARYADAVVTVSDELASLLRRRHGLTRTPAVVLNAPDVDAAPPAGARPDLRASCGLGPDTPLVVYSGSAAPQRGLDVMIEGLPALPGVHVALVVNRPESPYVAGLLATAADLGVASRVHVLPYVPHENVVDFLSAADAGVIPIHHWPNHEIALITKYFEYAHAGLPIVVSDVRAMADTTLRTGIGEVFVAGDADDYVRALKSVLADPGRYRRAYDPALLEQWTWRRQAAILDEVYRRLSPAPAAPQTDPRRPHRPDPANRTEPGDRTSRSTVT
ncbi:glycosyltransferase involved in cell wall biosynthesis [Stackebrandtia albiflava]|uniref:Glycosyltransferase involved in cell wall biosynthesis n=1 Tax=Stackebrandtia albiflava TaxID=406432 RepID=A0A562V4F5_9ACTN|nr:glycosyltransferase [Stackebrandtia albiflava]TWJ12725.1 glycosyltransferase involved in cell wall biosynthesis [Stackebrandtia albiflava]